MSRKIVTEDNINLLNDIDVEFVSLVQYGAIQDGFRIVKGDKNMSKQFYKVLAPADVNEEKLNKVAKEYNLSLEQKAEDELQGYFTYKQAEDEQFELECKELIALDKDNNIYGIAAPSTKEGKEIEKESLDYETMDTLVDGIFASMDIMLGALRMPEAETASRKQMMLDALSNLQKHIEAVLSTTKADEILNIDNVEISEKYENLAELFYQVNDSSDEELEKEEKSEEVQKQFDDAYKQLDESLEKFKEKIFGEVENKAQEKFDSFLEKFEEMKTALNEKLNSELEQYAEKEETEKQVESLKQEIEEIKNTTEKRKSEIEEETTQATKTRPTNKRKFITFA